MNLAGLASNGRFGRPLDNQISPVFVSVDFCLEMGISSLTRFWRSLGAFAVLAVGVSLTVAADTTTSAKKTATSHASQASNAHSTSSHSTTSHGTSSRAKSGATKSHSTTSTTSHTASNHLTVHSSRSKKTTKSAKKRGQQVIDSDRARQIQEALIREHYLSGEPSGTWDSATQGAMQRYQADQGWQNKTTPDSRALIKLGLGPSNDHLLNPDSAMTSSAMRPSATASSAANGATSAVAMTPAKTNSAATAATTSNSATTGATGPNVDPASKTAPMVPDSNLKPATDSGSTPVPNQ